MLAIFDTIDEENRRILNQGRKEGRKEGRIEGRKEGRIEGRKEGIEKGKEEGRKEGKQEERKNVAQRLKEKGISIEIIIECTGLSIEQIKRL